MSGPQVTPPLTDEQLAAATIGPPEPVNGPIVLVPYDPAWPSLFARLAEQIRDALGDRVLLLEHVGSTSVPGLAAKPIIDMVLAVADSRDEASYVTPLEQCGFTLRIREPDWYEHRLLRAPDVRGNLHVFSAGCEEIVQMLLFRDWLRAHDDDRLLYEQRKRALAAQAWKYTQHYADAKTAVVQQILTCARRGRR
jgi:GrpB-like predicted nucleotidyltransferase (UPF0157 family)